MLAAVYGLKRAAQTGVDPAAGVALALGLGLVAAFLRRQRGQADPWIDLALFRRRGFSMPLAANTLSFFVLYGTQFFIAQYLQLVLGLSALHAGLWTIPSALGYLAGSALVPVAANRVPVRVADEREPGGHGRRLRAPDAGRAGVRPRRRGAPARWSSRSGSPPSTCSPPR